MFTVHGAVPLHTPVQPLKVWFMSGVAVSETAVPSVKKLVHAPDRQEIPAGDEATEPFPVTLTVSLCALAGALNVAVTAWSCDIVTAQDVAPVQAPVHPVKVAPPCAAAVSVTCASAVKLAVHWPGQLMPGGVELTVPEPEAVTASEWLLVAEVNDAPTCVSADIVTVQVRAAPL